MLERISKEEFKKKLDSGEYVLIDVRTQDENNQMKIADSLVCDITRPDFAEKIQSLDKNKKYLIYCMSGNRSSHALGFMGQAGFKEACELEGGIMNW
ncbi:hypothetical protein A3E89_01805 [Candidatus Campbellbacteria bacterium RIFCSPHIGHO2_12_FULL_35_10]|uniref:Rhodanese domain-containing protein n=1 Tax=Candidatus Campbellbacteria bacterium RIFCSPHIGHO2_12_FULL_35_10 TaxID=1797578 RepID=A0A1F5EN12_9BACT|nr:MAG: hypothetical protein A3E89_01805 [Candidatus Campbellbacteria bacterium RIFCSPHIGHO2_12_FULL_35_10]